MNGRGDRPLSVLWVGEIFEIFRLGGGRKRCALSSCVGFLCGVQGNSIFFL